MSIAVSAIVNPSRSLLSILIGASLVGMSVGVFLLSDFEADGLHAGVRASAIAACFAFAIFGLGAFSRMRKVHRIDISGNGQIRLMETGDVAHTFDSDVAELLSDSTIWPRLMVLKLRAREGKETTILVLPDCMNPAAFHQLKVACRWIAAHEARRKS